MNRRSRECTQGIFVTLFTKEVVTTPYGIRYKAPHPYESGTSR